MTLTVYQFADQMMAAEDLDPVYIMLTRGKLPPAQLDRWLMAYWCFYHVGAASWLSEQGDDYWKWMYWAAENNVAVPAPGGGRWPRGTERRHFRGAKCVTAINHLKQSPPEVRISGLEFQTTLDGVLDIIRHWPMFGPWIGFKVADMLEVVKATPIRFTDDIALLYKEPRAGLDIIAAEAGQQPREALIRLKEYMFNFVEPAAGRRRCNVQEAETVLCKFKSHLNGHYPVGKDTREIRHALVGWGETANWLLRHAPAIREAA
jgi:Alpha-glutamyl/putrescinyl thymine pyrophosphorylase clade 2